jgi:hypothetical protein
MKGLMKKIDRIVLDRKLANTALFKGLGFRKEYPDTIDHKCWWWIKKYRKHPLFNNLEIMVEQSGILSVWVTEKDVEGRNDVMIIKHIFTEEKLEQVCNFFNQGVK